MRGKKEQGRRERDLHVTCLCVVFVFFFLLQAISSCSGGSQPAVCTHTAYKPSKEAIVKDWFQKWPTILLYTSHTCSLFCVCVCNFVVILFPIQTVGDAISDLLTVEVILMYKGVGTQL